MVFVGHAKLSLPGAPENVLVCLEDSSVVDDEDVFSALPVNTCLVLLCGENTPGNSSVTTCNTSHTKQQRLAFCGGNFLMFYENPPKRYLFRFVLTFCLNVWMCDEKIETFGWEIMPRLHLSLLELW